MQAAAIAATMSNSPDPAPIGAHLTLTEVGRVFVTGKRTVTALDDISFTVAPGEAIALIGPSGAGKSTLLRLIADLDQPSQGRILLDQCSPSQARHQGWIGMVFQESVLLPWRTALDNVMLPAQVGYGRRVKGQGRTRERAAALLDRVGLSGFHDAYIWQLSGGMRQRVSIARALMLHPRMLLLDEPFGALDEITRERMNAELGRVLDASGATSILVTHSISEAILLADRIVVLSAHPGKLYRIQPVSLPRPRGIDQMTTPEFVELSMTLRRLLGEAEAQGRRENEPI
jgi:NitT/TauT family transport system ATP-binding protein